MSDNQSPPAPDPEHLTQKHLDELMKEWERRERQLKDQIEELHTSDKAEREQLRTELNEAKTYIDNLEKARQERDKVEQSTHTMVLPPHDIPPSQPGNTPNGPPPNETSPASVTGDQPRRRIRDLW